jgi:hypothetical protein
MYLLGHSGIDCSSNTYSGLNEEFGGSICIDGRDDSRNCRTTSGGAHGDFVAGYGNGQRRRGRDNVA